MKTETWPKVKGLKRNCWNFSTHFSSTFPSISVHGRLPTPTPAAALKQHSRRTAVSLCLCLTPRHLCFRDPKPAYGLVKKGWRPIRRPLLTSARRVPIDRSITSEWRSLHPGYFKHIIQPTANHGPRQARGLLSAHLLSVAAASSAAARCGRRNVRAEMRVGDAAVSLGTLGRFLERLYGGEGKVGHYSNGKKFHRERERHNDCEVVD